MKKYKTGLVLLAIALSLLVYFSPWFFLHIAAWQKDFNQLISENLHQIQNNSIKAGITLIFASFVYGVLHALGPGHGKFIIASYLSTHESQLKQSTILSLLSSLMQGIVAITATTLLVVVLNLSSRYFKLSQLWLERAALLLLVFLGFYWIWQGLRAYRKKAKLTIKSLNPLPLHEKSAVKNNRTFQPNTCSCGHQHLPSPTQTAQATNLKSQFLVILTIGMRPCSGAIFVLFLAYMLDLYGWGILAVLAMSFGTGLMLSAFAGIVRYARNTAIHLGRWYSSKHTKGKSESIVKLIAGGIMLFFALSLLYGTLNPVNGGSILFGN